MSRYVIVGVFAWLLLMPLRASAAEEPSEDSPAPWSVRLAGGLGADARLVEIVAGNFHVERHRTGIVGIEVGRQLVSEVFGWPIDLVGKVGLIRHFERGFQDDFFQYTFSVKAYFFGFPWRDSVLTRLGFAEGISYAEKIPAIERRKLDRRGGSNRLLNHLDVSFDVHLFDLFGARALRSCFFGFAVSHRSGVFGLFDLYGNVHGGSNYNTLYVECAR